MKTNNIFMSGEWKDLIMSTYEIDKSIIEPYLPKNTEIDFYKNKALLSMIAFTFSKVKFFGIRVPFHQYFGQINFRFYVKSKIDGAKGVVFVKEFAPKPFIACIANWLYNEPYHYKKIRFKKIIDNNQIKLNYSFRGSKIDIESKLQTSQLINNTFEHFVVDRYIAFIKNHIGKTFQYKIYHKPWEVYNLKSINIDKTILNLLPKEFKNLKHISTCYVKGSSIEVQKGILQ